MSYCFMVNMKSHNKKFINKYKKNNKFSTFLKNNHEYQFLDVKLFNKAIVVLYQVKVQLNLFLVNINFITQLIYLSNNINKSLNIDRFYLFILI